MISLSKTRIIPVAVAFALTIAGLTAALAADIVVVANPKVADSSLSDEQIKGIFLGQMKAWPSGVKAEVVILKETSDLHEDFLNKHIGRSAAQFNNTWKQLVFTGKGRMPKEFATEGKLSEYVSATEGAVGYISSGTAKGSAKAISIK